MDFMRDGSALQRDMNEVFLGLFDSLRDGDRDFSSLSLTNPNPPVTVTDDNERAEVEALSTLHNFCDTVNEDHLVFEA
jgi:hypothetical protein